MADISKEINDFKKAVYGEEVRNSMVSLANKLNTEASAALQNSLDAKGIANNLNQKIDKAVTDAGEALETAQSFGTLIGIANRNANDVKSDLKSINDGIAVARIGWKQRYFNTGTNSYSAAESLTEIASERVKWASGVNHEINWIKVASDCKYNLIYFATETSAMFNQTGWIDSDGTPFYISNDRPYVIISLKKKDGSNLLISDIDNFITMYSVAGWEREDGRIRSDLDMLNDGEYRIHIGWHQAYFNSTYNTYSSRNTLEIASDRIKWNSGYASEIKKMRISSLCKYNILYFGSETASYFGSTGWTDSDGGDIVVPSDRPYIMICLKLKTGTDIYIENIDNYVMLSKPAKWVGETGGYQNIISCWGDSLTAQGGWTSVLSQKTGMTVVNNGVGGETCHSIMARHGSDPVVVSDVVIPGNGSTVTIGNRTNGLNTLFGNKAFPLLQGLTSAWNTFDIKGNECSIELDANGNYRLKRASAGDDINITRETSILPSSGKNNMNPYLMIILMGQNGGYDSVDEIVNYHRLMLEKDNPKYFLILGMHSGSSASRAEYEQKMKKEFGARYVSLREYLTHPIYNGSNISSCYGLADVGLTATTNDIADIRNGIVPARLLADGVHFTDATKTAIGNMIYNKICQLGFFEYK